MVAPNTQLTENGQQIQALGSREMALQHNTEPKPRVVGCDEGLTAWAVDHLFGITDLDLLTPSDN